MDVWDSQNKDLVRTNCKTQLFIEVIILMMPGSIFLCFSDALAAAFLTMDPGDRLENSWIANIDLHDF